MQKKLVTSVVGRSELEAGVSWRHKFCNVNCHGSIRIFHFKGCFKGGTTSQRGLCPHQTSDWTSVNAVVRLVVNASVDSMGIWQVHCGTLSYGQSILLD